MQFIAIENGCDRPSGIVARCVRPVVFVVLFSCLFGSALYAASLAERIQEIVPAEKWIVTASVVQHQTLTGIDSMFKR